MGRVRGIARLGRKTKELIPRLKPGEIAVIDHEDLDEVAAIGLATAKPAAVINARRSISGRYPTPGPAVILDADIPLIDAAGEEIFARLSDGDEIEVDGAIVYHDGNAVASGIALTEADVRAAHEEAKRNLVGEIEQFVLNTLEFAHKERNFILGSVRFPPLKTPLKGRPAVVVVRGPGYLDDLKAIASYIDEVDPVLVGVDGGADALIESGRIPDLIIGDMDSVSDAALRSGAELIVHAYPDGRSPGLARLNSLGLQAGVVSSVGTSEDVTLLMLYELGAAIIVAVGTHSNIVDFFEKGRPGMASTFLVRLKVGSILVDAKGLNQLYRGAPRRRDSYLIMTAALAPILLVALISRPLLQWLKMAALYFRLLAGF